MTKYLEALKYCVALRVIWGGDVLQIVSKMVAQGFSDAETAVAIAQVCGDVSDDYELVIVQRSV